MLILTPPDTSSPGGLREAARTVPAKAGRAVPALPSRRAVTQHCRFYCPWCGSMILLPHDRIGMPFANPYLRKIDSQSIASVCSSCSHVAVFSLFRGVRGYDTRHSLLPAQPAGDTVLLDWLKCEEKNCSNTLPLFLVPDEPLSVEKVKELGLRWDWKELTCAAGHRILAPLWLFGRAQYQFPAQLG